MSSLKRIVVTNWMMQGGGSSAPIIMLCYYVGQQVFEEYMDNKRWLELKKTLEWEQLPIITLEYEKGSLKEGTDDKMLLTNSIPTLRLLGQTFGYYFNNIDINNRYNVDVWLELCSHCMKTLYPSMLLNGDEKKKEIKGLIETEGKLYKWFDRFNRKLEKLYEEHDFNSEDILDRTLDNFEKMNLEEKKLIFLVKNKISIADFNFFSTINSIVCGRFKGIDESFLNDFKILKKWKDEFLEHYKCVLESKPKKEEYPFVIHNNRYYVNGKDQTEYWGNDKNKLSEDYMKDRKIINMNQENKKVDNTEYVNIKMSSEKFKDLNKEIKKEVQEEILTRESTLKEVETASIKVLKSTLKKHNRSYEDVILKSELVNMVKDVLTKAEAV